MQNCYLIDYIKENLNIDQTILESIKFELDQHIYYYGRQFKYPKEVRYDLAEIKKEIVSTFRQYVDLVSCPTSPNLDNGKQNVLSNAYSATNVELAKLAFNVYRPAWDRSKDSKALLNRDILREIEYFKNSFKKQSFADLISQKFINRVHIFKSVLKKYFLDHEIAAIFVPNDLGFFETLSIKVCRQINRPSCIFLHGLPGRYNNIDDNKTDYLIVWGERIKNNYIHAGIDGKKIYVSGHPYYKKLNRADLKFNLDSPLIITKAMNGAQHRDDVRLTDRGNLILYLYMVQSVLRRFGVKRVRFRPHPSENSDWYLRFIDRDFYHVDDENLHKSLQKSTIVIGPTSTVFLETLYNGVNYVCFEPSWNNTDLTNFELVPPFDGSDERLLVAKNEEQLEYILKAKAIVDISIFNEYIKTPFDLSFIKTII